MPRTPLAPDDPASPSDPCGPPPEDGSPSRATTAPTQSGFASDSGGLGHALESQPGQPVTRVPCWPSVAGTQSTFTHNLSLSPCWSRQIGQAQGTMVRWQKFVLDSVCRLCSLSTSGFLLTDPSLCLGQGWTQGLNPSYQRTAWKDYRGACRLFGEMCDESGGSPCS